MPPYTQPPLAPELGALLALAWIALGLVLVRLLPMLGPQLERHGLVDTDPH
jgi:hypothetical protein